MAIKLIIRGHCYSTHLLTANNLWVTLLKILILKLGNILLGEAYINPKLQPGPVTYVLSMYIVSI